MDTPITQFDIDQYEELLDDAPESVRRFLWGNEYQQMVSALATYYALSEESHKKLNGFIFDLVIGYSNEDMVRAEIATLGIDTEKQEDLINYMYEYFVQPMGIRAEVEYEINREDESFPRAAAAPSPADVLQSLKSRLTTPGAIAPAARELPPPATEKAADAPAAPAKPSVDPYREIPT